MTLFSRKLKARRTFEDIVTPKPAKEDDELEKIWEEVQESVPVEGTKSENVVVTETQPVLNQQPLKEEEEEPKELDPLDCFFMKGEDSEKWLLKFAKVWHYIISVVWFFIGAFSFAPVIYMSHKSRPIFKDKKKSLICGIMVYSILMILLIIVLL